MPSTTTTLGYTPEMSVGKLHVQVLTQQYYILICMSKVVFVSTFKFCGPLLLDGKPGDLQQSAEKEIFLSYGHTEDVDRFVLELQKDLGAHGFSVWLDKTDICPGSNWRRAIGV